MTDDLELKVDGKVLSGWTGAALTRSMLQLPNTFVISATQDSPVARDAAYVREGQPCEVSIGGDLVLTGYVDQVDAAYAAGSHTVQIAGRGKCQDLVDCAAKWASCQMSGSNALEIAQKLAEPYGITATCPSDPGPAVPQFNINVSDTVADVLELVTRHAALLYYEGVDGNLLLSDLVEEDAGSGFVEGENVQAARFTRASGERYSEYICALLSVSTSSLLENQDGLFYFTAEDPNVGRLRRLVIVAEGVVGGLDLAEKRARWEASRRAGRSRSAVVTADDWRDGKGKLWTPNTLAPVSLPRLGLTDAAWCIAEVIYRLDGSAGRTSEVTLMPRESFLPEPIQLQPLLPGLEGANPLAALEPRDGV